MRVHPRQGSVVSTLAAVLIAACICGAQSAQPGLASIPIGSAKPLLLERNEGELRVRRAVSGAPSQSGAQPAAPVPFIFEGQRKTMGPSVWC
jgi:hypothetical protein